MFQTFLQNITWHNALCQNVADGWYLYLRYRNSAAPRAKKLHGRTGGKCISYSNSSRPRNLKTEHKLLTQGHQSRLVTLWRFVSFSTLIFIYDFLNNCAVVKQKVLQGSSYRQTYLSLMIRLLIFESFAIVFSSKVCAVPPSSCCDQLVCLAHFSSQWIHNHIFSLFRYIESTSSKNYIIHDEQNFFAWFVSRLQRK